MALNNDRDEYTLAGSTWHCQDRDGSLDSSLSHPQGRGHPDTPPPTISDGWGGIDETIFEVYGRVPEYSDVGRSPECKRLLPGWQCVQMVKVHENGRRVGTKLRVIYGEEQATLKLLGQSTAYVERTHTTIRTFSSRLTRRTLAFSKQLRLCRAAAAWNDGYYNWARAHKSLCLKCENDPLRRWQPRSPAMVAGLTDRIWTVQELLTTGVPPGLNNTQ